MPTTLCKRTAALAVFAAVTGCASVPQSERPAGSARTDSIAVVSVQEELPPLDSGEPKEFRVTGEAYHEFQVEKPVEVVDLPAAAYPASLRGVKGRVRMTFIVDTLGRAEPASIQRVGDAEPHSAASAFTESARAAILAGKFRPAGLAGANVRGWVIRDFEFSPPR